MVALAFIVSMCQLPILPGTHSEERKVPLLFITAFFLLSQYLCPA